MKLGKAIKIARTRRGWKQGQLAEYLNVSANYISLLENDRRDPSWSFVCRLAGALNVPLPLLILLADDDLESERTKTRTTITDELLHLVLGLRGQSLG